jgi:putative serine/threonine protein kinase
MHKNKNMELIAKGKRSYVYLLKQKEKKIAFKVVIDKKRTKNVIKNEKKFLNVVNKEGIGPKFIGSGKDYVSYYYIEGIRILDFIKNADKKLIINILKEVLEQCYKLDKIGLNKEELHKPVKHILIANKKPVMIDFERSHYSSKPKNVSQFCQFLMSKNLKEILLTKQISINKEEMINKIKIYKSKMSYKNLKNISLILQQ